MHQDEMMVKYGGRMKYPGNIISDGTICVRVSVRITLRN